MQPVQIPIQGLVPEGRKIFFQKLAQRRASNPVRHGVFGARTNQTVQGHRFGQGTDARGKSSAAEDGVQAELAPHLVPDVHRTGLARLLDLDLVHFNGDRGVGGGGGLLPPNSPPTQSLDLGRNRPQRGLPLQRRLDFVR